MSEGQNTAELRGLDQRYEVLGELRGTDAVRTYIGRMKDPAAEVAIMVVRAPGQNNELSHLASDARMLVNMSHPGMIRVIDGCWLGTTAFAVVTDRVNGDSLGERLERGEQFSSPRIAAILEDVKAVLDWARDKGVVHRGVTPDTLIFEQGSDRVRVSLGPTPIAMSGVPDGAGDARTIAMLAWAMYAGKPYGESDSVEPLASLAPNLATRVTDAVTKMLAAKDHAAAPDVATFIATIAAADVLKQAEVEIAAMKEEYDEQHARELQKCEVQRQETEQHAAEQASILAGEREEFDRIMSDERAAIEAERTAMASERAEFDRLMKERKDKLAAVRAELDQQRADLERRLSELEAYRLEVERVRKEALAAGAAVAATAVPAPPPHLKKPPKTDWEKFEAIDQDESDLVAVGGEGGRPRWMIPAGIATMLIILVAGIFSLTHRTNSAPAIRLGNSTVVPTAPGIPPAPAVTPRGGFLTQTAGGALAPNKFSATPFTRPDSSNPAAAAAPIDSTSAHTDSTHRANATASNPAADSAAAARRAAARREAARERAAAERDFTNPTPRPIPDPPADSVAKPVLPPPAPVTPRRDTATAPRDTARARPDTGRTRPDTTRVRPDTTRK
ncbi:MAG TPA: protein kinase [Gemmatimonadaceae bacterium]|nr:protein kinase [Gemmatimonadaceae bacterium]